MKSVYYHRAIEPLLRDALKQFPAVLITGPRQAGKSTLLRKSLKNFSYVSLDDPALRSLARRDPKLFLSTYPPPVIFDEVQYAPELLSYIKIAIDERRSVRGRFVLTGSQIFPMMQGVSETLAGRVAIFNLYPFHAGELPAHRQQELGNSGKLAHQIIRGFYPEPNVNTGLNVERWFASYISTYLERDVRNIRKISDLTRFQTYVSLLAGRAGGLLNLSEVAKECGITQPTAKDWLTMLQSTYVVHVLPPWHRNISKRVIKSPKLYFVDTGLLCYLLGIDTPERFFKSADGGRIFENMVVIEALKRVAASDRRSNLYFYRTAAGVEVDLLMERGGVFHACEIKLSETPDPSMAGNLQHAAKDLNFKQAAVLTLQKSPLPLTAGITAMNWRDGLERILADS